MRERLGGCRTVDYQVERSNNTWADHRLRTLVTAAAIAWLRPNRVIDPACGDGSIVMAADRLSTIQHAMLGDISHPNVEHVIREAGKGRGWSFRAGDIEQALEGLSAPADVIVFTEILEHLDDPDRILRLAKAKARYLVASSPEMRDRQSDTNPEHLWMFDRDGYREMLEGAGWVVQQYTYLNFPTEYDFGIWVCS